MDLVDYLLRKEADPNIRGECQRSTQPTRLIARNLGGKYGSAIHIAAAGGNIDMVRRLRDKGANADLTGEGYNVGAK